MTKKDYVAIAEILREASEMNLDETVVRNVVSKISKDLSRYFLRDNPNFDPYRFYNSIYMD